MNDEVYRKVFENIKKTGQYPAIIVRPKQGTDRYEILDGWHRRCILQELVYDEVKCEVWDVDDKQAKLLLVTLNRLKGTDDTKKRARLLTELYEEFNHDKSLLNLIPESERALTSMLSTMSNEQLIVDTEIERGLVEEKLMQAGVDSEMAQAMADKYDVPSSSAVWVLKFVFKDNYKYNKAIEYFGKRGNPDDLVTLVETYGTQTIKSNPKT